MHYIVTFVKPNNIIVTGEQTKRCDSKSQVNKMLRDAKQYPGSLEIISVETVRKSGTTIVYY